MAAAAADQRPGGAGHRLAASLRLRGSSTVSTIPPRPKWASAAWWRAASSSGASASCRSGAGPTTAFPAATGTATQDLAKDHGELGKSLDRPGGGSAARLEGPRPWNCIRSSTGPPSSAACPAAKGASGATTTRRGSRVGLPAAVFRGGVSYGATDEWSYKAVDKPGRSL
jgi:hypothetical protein